MNEPLSINDIARKVSSKNVTRNITAPRHPRNGVDEGGGNSGSES
jgi:hypothetical protein